MQDLKENDPKRDHFVSEIQFLLTRLQEQAACPEQHLRVVSYDDLNSSVETLRSVARTLNCCLTTKHNSSEVF